MSDVLGIKELKNIISSVTIFGAPNTQEDFGGRIRACKKSVTGNYWECR
jgi:hypothetical protein